MESLDGKALPNDKVALLNLLVQKEGPPPNPALVERMFKVKWDPVKREFSNEEKR